MCAVGICCTCCFPFFSLRKEEYGTCRCDAQLFVEVTREGGSAYVDDITCDLSQVAGLQGFELRVLMDQNHSSETAHTLQFFLCALRRFQKEPFRQNTQ